MMLFLVLTTARADTASECIGMGRNAAGDGYLENRCDREVTIFWCSSFRGDGICNSDDKHYQKSRRFAAKEQYTNRFMFPAEGDSYYLGACDGSVNIYKVVFNGHHYWCPDEAASRPGNRDTTQMHGAVQSMILPVVSAP